MTMRALNLAALAPLQARHAHMITQLAAHQTEPGACQWSYQAFAAAMGRHLGPVKRIIKECASLGYIVVERATRPGRGKINVYRIAERFFLPERDSKSSTGKEEGRERESTTTTESTAARAKEKLSKAVPLKAPLSAEDKQRALLGWFGWLGEYVGACEPDNLLRCWEEQQVRLAGKRSAWLDALTARARASAWFTTRRAVPPPAPSLSKLQSTTRSPLGPPEPLRDVTVHPASAERAAELMAMSKARPAPAMHRSVYTGHSPEELAAMVGA